MTKERHLNSAPKLTFNLFANRIWIGSVEQIWFLINICGEQAYDRIVHWIGSGQDTNNNLKEFDIINNIHQ